MYMSVYVYIMIRGLGAWNESSFGLDIVVMQ